MLMVFYLQSFCLLTVYLKYCLVFVIVPGEGTVETEIINPAYVELGPCPCDVTTESCDVGCCCDELCTAEDLQTFTCLPGVLGMILQFICTY